MTPRRNLAAGFGLLELSLMIAGASLLLAVILPFVKQRVIEARASAVAHDLRAFAAAFQSNATQRGDWPPGDGTPGTIPDGMANSLRGTNWQQPTPIGGHYAWDPNGVHQGARHRAVIVIASTPDSPVSTDRTQLLELDRRLDDGNLAAGSLMLGYRNYPIFILEH